MVLYPAGMHGQGYKQHMSAVQVHPKPKRRLQEQNSELQRQAGLAQRQVARLQSKCASSEQALAEQVQAASAQAQALQKHFTGVQHELQDKVLHVELPNTISAA